MLTGELLGGWRGLNSLTGHLLCGPAPVSIITSSAAGGDTMADGNNSGSGWGWFWLIVVIALVGGGYLYQREGGKIFGPDGLAGKSGQKEAIQQVLRADSRTTTGVTSVSAVVARMRRIDLSKCPSDFRAAYTEHIHAWE